MTKTLPALTHCVNLTQVLAQLLRDLSAERLITLRLRQPNKTFYKDLTTCILISVLSKAAQSSAIVLFKLGCV